MKFIAFNIVVLGALFFLYRVSHAPFDSGQSPLEAAVSVGLADAAPVVIDGLERVREQLEVLASIEAHMDVRLEELEERAARADALLAELDSRAAGASVVAETGVPSRTTGPRQSKRTSPSVAPGAEVKRVAAVQEMPARTPEAPAAASDRLPVPRAEEVWVQNERGSDTNVAKRSGQSSLASLASSGTSEFTVAAKHAPAAAAAPEQTESVVIEGDLMTAQQRRGALLDLAEEMEMQFLVSSGLSDR